MVRILVTGPPRSGKSTFVERLVNALRACGHSGAVSIHESSVQCDDDIVYDLRIYMHVSILTTVCRMLRDGLSAERLLELHGEIEHAYEHATALRDSADIIVQNVDIAIDTVISWIIEHAAGCAVKNVHCIETC